MSEKVMRGVWRVARWPVLIWLLSFVTMVSVQLFWNRNAPLPDPADAIICLGAGAEETGEAGPGSARRARTCAELFTAGVAPTVVFTGGAVGTPPPALGMAHVARDMDVPAQAIRVETASLSTIQNAAFSRTLLPEGATRVVVVSDAFHLPRAYVIFRALGYEDVALHPAPQARYGEALKWSLRESVALWFNLWRAGLYAGGGLLGIDAQTRIAWFD